MKAEFYHDFYGCTASIRQNRSQQFVLTIRSGTGQLLFRKPFKTHKGARISMGKQSDCWKRTV